MAIAEQIANYAYRNNPESNVLSEPNQLHLGRIEEYVILRLHLTKYR